MTQRMTVSVALLLAVLAAVAAVGAGYFLAALTF